MINALRTPREVLRANRVVRGVLLAGALTTASSAFADLDCAALQGAAAPDRLAIADCYRAGHQPTRALDVLYAELAATPTGSGTELRTLAIHARIAAVLASLGEYQNAREYLLRGVELATGAGLPAQAAPLLNDLGTTYMATGEAPAGIAAFADSYRLAPDASALAVTAGINLARALEETGAGSAASGQLQPLRDQALALPTSAAKGAALLELASLSRESSPNAAVPSEAQRRARELAVAGLEVARELDDERLLAAAYNELSEWHLAQEEFDDALALARQAALAAQPGGASDNLYRAEWTSGRALQALGRKREALAAYRAAVDTLAAMQSTLVTSTRRFRTEIVPLYREYSDVMFASTAGLPADAAREALLEVQQALERLRLAEVLNYFENQCAVPEVFDVDAVRAGSAVVIYPVIFADRTELLVSTQADVLQFTAPVGLTELTTETRLLRAALEDTGSGTAYLAPARRLFSWLIEPLLPVIEAAQPEALVFVPDGPLRSVPLGALYDGQQFLIERYAVASTPGLSLVTASESPPTGRVLANGIVDPVQGFPALPFVETELQSIAELFPTEVYADEAFLSDTLRREILQGGYTIVHLATHAQFESDYERSFLLAYDDLITMDELEDVMSSQRFTISPVDLIVLSACQTAAGDDRAALGLAGVAVKAGARSALASLWHINDESTSQLIAEFYRQLASGYNKAAALRGAQLMLMNDERYAHPAYWAPFLMIGDWR
jgi:CHAT domain-containing protein